MPSRKIGCPLGCRKGGWKRGNYETWWCEHVEPVCLNGQWHLRPKWDPNQEPIYIDLPGNEPHHSNNSGHYKTQLLVLYEEHTSAQVHALP